MPKKFQISIINSTMKKFAM